MAKKKKTGSGVDASPRRNGRPRPIARRPHQVPRVSVAFPERGLTRGSFKDECDINRIVDTYARTGIVNHIPRVAPQYGDNPEQSLFEAACIQAEIRSSEEDAVLNPPPAAESGPDPDDLDSPADRLPGDTPEPENGSDAPQGASDAES